MPQAKLMDIQRTTITVPVDEDYALITITHNLKDQYGNYLRPDSVDVNIVDFDGNEMGGKFSFFSILHPSVPDGTCNIRAATETNASGAGWTFIIEVTSVYYHSILTSEHAT